MPYFLLGTAYTKFSETGKYQNLSQTNTFERLGMQIGFGIKYRVTKKFGIFCEGTYINDSIVPKFIDEYLGITDSAETKNLSVLHGNIGLTFDFRKK